MKETDDKNGRSTKKVIQPELRFLVGRREAAQMLSISERALDYLISRNEIPSKRIGSRVLIATADLRRYTLSDHPESIAGKR